MFASAHAFVVTDAAYRPRNPEESLLYQVVAGELETFLASHQAQDRTIPKFVEDEFRSFLECGILAHGFVRVRCESCGHSPLVPFSSRRRGAEREPDSLAQVLYLRAYRAGEEPPEDAWMLDWTDWAGAYEIMLRRRQEYQELTVSRWRDPVWLAWLAVPMLMVHMFEEYGFDVLGRTYDFPDGICRTSDMSLIPVARFRQHTIRWSTSGRLGGPASCGAASAAEPCYRLELVRLVDLQRDGSRRRRSRPVLQELVAF